MASSKDAELIRRKSTENPPIPSDAGVSAWEEFERLTTIEQEELQARSFDTVNTVFDFGGTKKLVSSVYEAAPLVGLMERLNSSDKKEATRALKSLKRYHSDNQQDIDYVRAISGDMLKINAFINQHIRTSDDANSIIPLRDVLELVSDTVSEDVKNPQGVNIVSILIAAASAYNTLRDAKDMSDADEEVSKALYAVENFFGPLLEIIGYDGFAMALRRESGLHRMTEGNGSFTNEDLQRARNEIKAVGLDKPEKVPAIVAEMMERLFVSRGVETASVLHNVSGHGTQFGTGRILGESDDGASLFEVEDDGLRFTWRVKTDVSIAKEIHKGPEQYSSDILGVTVIVPTYEILADAMAVATGFLSESVSLSAKHSASRDTHIHAKGEDVVKALLPVLAENLNDLVLHVDQKPSSNGHQLGKITMLYQPNKNSAPIPVEVQFQTTDDREVSRAGKAAHAFKDRNYIVSPEDLRVIKRLHERRTMTTEPGLTEHSQQFAKELFSRRPKRTIREMAAAGLRLHAT